MPGIPAIDVEQLRDMLQSPEPPVLIDVREKWENELCSIPTGELIPLGDFSEKYATLPKDKTIIIYCHTGQRSGRAAAFLMQQGYSKVFNLAGGIHAWSLRIDPSVKTY